VNAARVARDTITEVGYTSTEFGFDAEHSAVLVSLDQQSPDIAQGVNRALEIRHGKDHDGYLDSVGAGDQGMVFGFASDETPEYLPTPIALAHRLSRRLAEVRKTGVIPYLRPDGKSQVTVTYEGERPVRVDTIVISAQHSPDVTLEQIREEIITGPGYSSTRPDASWSAVPTATPVSPDARLSSIPTGGLPVTAAWPVRCPS